MRSVATQRRGRFSGLVAFALLAMSLAPAAASSPRTLAGARPGATRPSLVGWPRQYFDLLNDGNNPYETQISASNVAQLQVAWSSPVDSYVWEGAGPLVVDGTVYVGTHSRVYAVN